MDGWLKLHRKIIESEIFTDERLLQVWLGVLMRATYKDRKIKYGNQQKTLLAGQAWYCLRTEAKRLGVAHTTLREKLKYLEKSERVSYTSGPFGYIVTICNWDKYQSDDDISQKSFEHKNTTLTPLSHHSHTNTRIKEVKKEKKEYPWSALLDLWNQNCGALPKAKSWSTKREKLAAAAWGFNQDTEFYLLGIKNIAKDAWANGSKPSPSHPNWRADFDYFLRDPNKWAERGSPTKANVTNDLPILE